MPKIFRADPSMLYTGDDIFPDSPLFRERLLCRLARSLRSLAREQQDIKGEKKETRKCSQKTTYEALEKEHTKKGIPWYS